MSTEADDPRFADVDRWPTISAVEAMLEGQLAAIASLAGQAGRLATAAEAAARRLSAGGRLVYVGAGTSGRVAAQDGVELVPTYGWARERLIILVAGGAEALARSIEGAEDDADTGRRSIDEVGIGPSDVIVGVAASGRTPYTVAALDQGRSRGALTIGIANNGATPLLDAAEYQILAETGPEIVSGSTRMKAGTAQKAALNILSTAIMLRLGLVHGGLMVNMKVSNAKLEERARRMVAKLAGVDDARATAALAATGQDIRLAVLVARGLEPELARARLAAAGFNLHDALAARQADA